MSAKVLIFNKKNNERGFWLAEGYGMTPDRNMAFKYDRSFADGIVATHPNALEISELTDMDFEPTLNIMARSVHAENALWWTDLETGERKERNKGELLMLIVSEVAEAMEGERKDLMDDKLPHRKMAEVELADVLIRVFDYAGAYGFDLDGAVAEKRAFNLTRQDHSLETRRAAGGKKF